METINVNTALGVLSACIFYDSENRPSIYTYIKRKDGVEIDLVEVEVDAENDIVTAYLYGDVSADCYTKRHKWTREEIHTNVD